MKHFAITVALAALAGCAQAPTAASVAWSKPGATPADLTQDSARCRLVARNTDPEPVLYPTLGRALIGNQIVQQRQQRDFNDCMVAQGWGASAQ